MENVLRWDCTCDACDREGRYHNISGQGLWKPPPSKPGPNWLLLLICIGVGIGLVLYLRSLS